MSYHTEHDRSTIEYYSMKCIRRASIALRNSLDYIEQLEKVQKKYPSYASGMSIEQMKSELIEAGTRINEWLAIFEEVTNSELPPTEKVKTSINIDNIPFFDKKLK